MMMLPFRSMDASILDNNISVIGENRGGAGWQGNTPYTVTFPVHRILPVIGNQSEAFSPLSKIFDSQFNFHTFIFLCRSSPIPILKRSDLEAVKFNDSHFLCIFFVYLRFQFGHIPTGMLPHFKHKSFKKSAIINFGNQI